jgi:hypothetical protein
MENISRVGDDWSAWIGYNQLKCLQIWVNLKKEIFSRENYFIKIGEGENFRTYYMNNIVKAQVDQRFLKGWPHPIYDDDEVDLGNKK